MTPDVNVLLAASRLDHPHHAEALAWLEGARLGPARGERLSVLPMVAAGFLRLATHPRVFPDPTPPARALAFLEAVLATPGADLLPLGEEWALFAEWCGTHGAHGNDVPDVWIAAAVRAHREHLVTFDRRFGRYLRGSEWTLLGAG